MQRRWHNQALAFDYGRGQCWLWCGRLRCSKESRVRTTIPSRSTLGMERTSSSSFVRRPSFCSSIDHSWQDDTFVTCSTVISVWSPERQEPIHEFSYQTENLLKAKFNPAEAGLLAATSSERGVLLYDVPFHVWIET